MTRVETNTAVMSSKRDQAAGNSKFMIINHSDDVYAANMLPLTSVV